MYKMMPFCCCAHVHTISAKIGVWVGVHFINCQLLVRVQRGKLFFFMFFRELRGLRVVYSFFFLFPSCAPCFFQVERTLWFCASVCGLFKVDA